MDRRGAGVGGWGNYVEVRDICARGQHWSGLRVAAGCVSERDMQSNK